MYVEPRISEGPLVTSSLLAESPFEVYCVGQQITEMVQLLNNLEAFTRIRHDSLICGHRYKPYAHLLVPQLLVNQSSCKKRSAFIVQDISSFHLGLSLSV